MNYLEKRKTLESSDNKLALLLNADFLSDLSDDEIKNLVNDFLTDSEKIPFLKSELMLSKPQVKYSIIDNISDSKILFQILHNNDIVRNISLYNLPLIFNKLDIDLKQQILFENDNIICKIIPKIPYLFKDTIFEVASLLPDEELKFSLIEKYDLDMYSNLNLLKSLCDERKKDIILEENVLTIDKKKSLLISLKGDSLANFIQFHNEFLSENNISIHKIVEEMSSKQQEEFITSLEALDLSITEKKLIMICLNDDVKENLDLSKFPEEYRYSIYIKSYDSFDDEIPFDPNINMEYYRDLDEYIKNIYPEKFTQSEREKVIELCEICPNIIISNDFETIPHYSTASEYNDAESWINSIIESIPHDCSDAQKIAIIDNAIGKKISYSPDFDTEIFKSKNARTLWKIISSGYGVCNGIANVEKYILDRIGIESEIISGEKHSFLKLKNIEFTLSTGETVKGTTILDPTWNLAAHKFGGMPENFCLSYEDIRKHDIDSKRKDYKCHKNDEKLQDATFTLDEQSLRNLFKSIGLTNEDGTFPIDKIFKESEKIDEFCKDDPLKNIDSQLSLIKKNCSDFVTCQNSTIEMIETIFSKVKNLNFEKCIVNRVFDKEDSNKTPITYTCIQSNEFGKIFYYADKTTNSFIKLNQEEFEKKFECYKSDLEKTNGVNPWNVEENKEEITNLNTSSGSIDEKDGDDR